MKQWYILFTCYENSLATMKRLVKSQLPRGCGTYTPSVLTGSNYHKTRVYNKPIYPFYAFVCCTDKKQLDILLKKMTSLHIDGYFLKNSSGEYETLTSEQIKNMETVRAHVPTVMETTYVPGEQVTVRSGPMLGVTGTVTSLSEEYVFISVKTKKGKFIELPVLASDLLENTNKEELL